MTRARLSGLQITVWEFSKNGSVAGMPLEEGLGAEMKALSPRAKESIEGLCKIAGMPAPEF